VCCAALSRAKYAPRRFVTKFFQFRNDFSESKANVSFDVLEEAELWSKKANAACDVGPKMSWVVCSKSLPGCTEWLAGVASRKDIHHSRKLLPREGFEIAPDRSRIKLPAFHSRK